jgi:ribose 5-phosphate isomerase B
MTIYIGADHRGFALKERLKQILKDHAYNAIDMGAEQAVLDDDYPKYAAAVAGKVAEAPLESRGILICGSGFGVDIVANKFDGVRSALAMSPDHAYQGRHDDDVNVLSLAGDFVDDKAAWKIIEVFLTTPFAREEKYSRRVGEIGKIEQTN